MSAVSGIQSLPQPSLGTGAPPAQAAQPLDARRSPDDQDLRSHPWRVLGPAGMIEVRRPRARTVRRLPAGSTVCLVVDTPGSRRRLRRVASRAGLEIERELLVLPATSSPLVVLDDAAAPVGRLWARVATVPPSVTRGWWAATLALRVARRLPWQWTGAFVPGRVLIGRRR